MEELEGFFSTPFNPLTPSTQSVHPHTECSKSSNDENISEGIFHVGKGELWELKLCWDDEREPVGRLNVT